MTETPATQSSDIKWPGLIAAALALLAVVLGILTSGTGSLGWDLTVATWIQRWEGSLAEALYRAGDMLGTTSLAAIIVAIGLIVALVRKRIQIAVFLALVLLFRLAGTQLKPLFDSPRPTVDELRVTGTFDGTGYPSGHSMTVAMVSMMLVLIVWRYVDDPRLRWLGTILAGVAVVLVGWSRVWAGAHWPSDVIGGWSFGITLVIGAWMLSYLIIASPVFRRDTVAETATG